LRVADAHARTVSEELASMFYAAIRDKFSKPKEEPKEAGF